MSSIFRSFPECHQLASTDEMAVHEWSECKLWHTGTPVNRIPIRYSEGPYGGKLSPERNLKGLGEGVIARWGQAAGTFRLRRRMAEIENGQEARKIPLLGSLQLDLASRREDPLKILGLQPGAFDGGRRRNIAQIIGRPSTVTTFISNAFFPGVQRTVRKDGTVRINHLLYEVDLALRGVKVELRFNPYSGEIEVFYQGQSFGRARPLNRQINSHLSPRDSYEKEDRS